MYAADEKSTNAVGLSLLSGFALMLLVENVCPHPNHPHHDDDEEEHNHFHTPERRASHSPILPKEQEECSSHATAHGMSATLGLVIHGLADGIALGASSLSDNKQLGLVVFLAVLVHKGELRELAKSASCRGARGKAARGVCRMSPRDGSGEKAASRGN